LEFQPDLIGQPNAMSSGSRLLILFTLAEQDR
jgi:hypothetical protein